MREIRFGLWMLRIQTQGVLKRIPRRGELTRAGFENTKIVPSVGVVLEKLECRLLLGDGLLQAAGRSQYLRQTGMARRIVRPELRGPLEFGESTP